MAKDSRERIENTDPLNRAEPEDEPEIAYQQAMRDYAPPGLDPNRAHTFSVQDLVGLGLSDAEIIRLQREGAAARNGGMTEYDEDAEHEILQKQRKQKERIAVIDGGDAVRLQLSEMEAYFSGAVPGRDGKYCKRYPYISPEKEIVGINGYIFNIPKHQRVMLPVEVLEILREKAIALQKYDAVSAIYAARQYRPLDAERDVDGYAAGIRNAHHVRTDLIPGNEMPTGR